MNGKTFKVLKGYSQLDHSERQELIELINRYEREGISERNKFIEVEKASLGPIGNDTCPCCGR